MFGQWFGSTYTGEWFGDLVEPPFPPVPPTPPISGGVGPPRFVFRVNGSHQLLEDDEVMIMALCAAAASGLLN